MADSNEAQLLNDLLREIARKDAALDALHLEARVIEAASPALSGQRDLRATGLVRWVMAAAVAAAVLAPAVLWRDAETSVPDTMRREPEQRATAEPAVTVEGPERANERPSESEGGPKARHYRKAPPSAESAHVIAESSVVRSPIAQSGEEFIPLMPMTDQELSGPFQLVRVQMPRASLGALRSPLELPNELVEADVLLGQDGMARAIRVSAGGSVYPWRFR